MAKVTYSFDEEDDLNDINIIANRHKLICAGYDIQQLRRDLEKGYLNNYITVKDDKVLTDKDYKENNYIPIDGTKSYIDVNEIIDRLDRIIDNIYYLLD